MKNKIDKYVSEYYQKLICIAQKKIAFFGRTMTAETLVSNAYLDVINKPPTKEEDIPRYLVKHIHQECLFYNSYTNRTERCLEWEYLPEDKDDKSNIEEHLTFLDWYAEYNQFKNGLDRYEQIVSDVYFLKGKRTTRELADHFNIPHTSAYLELKETLQKIKEYESKRSI